MCVCAVGAPCQLPARLFDSVWFHLFNFGLIDPLNSNCSFSQQMVWKDGGPGLNGKQKVDDFNMRNVQKVPLYLLCTLGDKERARL